MSKADAWIDRLRTATTREGALTAVWDLRDDAYDFPDEWQRFTAVRLLNFLADQLEEHVAEDAVDWAQFGSIVASAVGAARSEQVSNWDG